MRKILSVHDLKDETPFDFIGNTTNRIHDSKNNGAYNDKDLSNVVSILSAVFNNARKYDKLPSDSYGGPEEYIEANEEWLSTFKDEETSKKYFSRGNKDLSSAYKAYGEEAAALELDSEKINHHSFLKLRK